jgi:hypothetical protein
MKTPKISASSSILCGSMIKNQMESDNSMDEPKVPTPKPKKSKSKKTPKPKKPLEPLKRLIIESGIFVLEFD